LLAELRPYQQQGLSWMQLLRKHGLGGVLADDMGLGKTLQAISHLLLEKQARRLTAPALIVAPTSLVGNWRNELERFAPKLSILVLHGQQRHHDFTRMADHDVVITTYPLLLRDEETLTKQAWSIVVLDEAQAIKNAKTRIAGIVLELPAQQRLCLTGTPMENHLGEVWSLFHFLMPGYLGSETRFKQLFRTPIEKHGDAQRLALLRARLSPFMLRRTKAAVAKELPPKIETIEHIELPASQANLYEVIRVATEAKVQAALASKGLARSQIAVLDALLKLRQVCCDPALVPLDAAKKVKASAKMDWLIENLPAMVEEGRRILVFSQFTSMLTLIEKALAKTSLSWVKLTGQSQKREAIIEQFTSGQVPLFLISLKAGGVGLNLPQADTVIHVDPWWNPAAEDQATDRAHRMGQQSTVFVYKLVAQGTLEERIVAMQARKAALAKGLHGDALSESTRLTEGELDWLLQPIGAATKL
jgi:SNF2 family DNA or RNA helicase